jgi:hypothetical protein
VPFVAPPTLPVEVTFPELAPATFPELAPATFPELVPATFPELAPACPPAPGAIDALPSMALPAAAAEFPTPDDGAALSPEGLVPPAADAGAPGSTPPTFSGRSRAVAHATTESTTPALVMTDRNKDIARRGP